MQVLELLVDAGNAAAKRYDFANRGEARSGGLEVELYP